MTRKPYATRHIGRQDGLLARRFRSTRRVRLLSAGVPRWWTTYRPWSKARHLIGSAGLCLSDARRMRMWAMASRMPLPPMRPPRPWTVPLSWRADR